MKPRSVPFYLHGLTLNDAPDGEDGLICPACKTDAMQLIDVRVLPAGVDGLSCQVTAQGVHLGRFTQEDDGPQGTSIAATFQCANGHDTVLLFSCEGARTRVSTAVTRTVERRSPIWQKWRHVLRAR